MNNKNKKVAHSKLSPEEHYTKGNIVVKEDLKEQFIKSCLQPLTEELPSVSAIGKHLGIPDRTARRWFKERQSMLVRDKDAFRFNEKQAKNVKNYSGVVAVACQNDAPIDHVFYETLKAFCKRKNALLLVGPVFYQYSEESSVFMVEEQDLFYGNIQLKKDLKLMGKLALLPTLAEPLAALEPLSKNSSMIVFSPVAELKMVPVMKGKAPNIIVSTGSLNLPKYCYPINKTGIKAQGNHSISALYVKFGKGDSFHIRELNSDDNSGFYDIDGYYHKNKFTKLDRVKSVTLGDTHVAVRDKKIEEAIFWAPNSVMKTLKPEHLIIHDSFDCQSVSHHDAHNSLLSTAKFAFGKTNLKNELLEHAAFYDKIAGAFPNTEISDIDSNHNRHLTQALTSGALWKDRENAEVAHWLAWMTLASKTDGDSGPRMENPLEIFVKKYEHGFKNVKRIHFRKGSFVLMGVEFGLHGDQGANGARGSIAGFSKLNFKSTVGHSHTPGRKKGCHQVGTSSGLDLGYLGPISTWAHAFSIQYKNGKRQMNIFVGDKWHAQGELA